MDSTSYDVSTPNADIAFFFGSSDVLAASGNPIRATRTDSPGAVAWRSLIVGEGWIRPVSQAPPPKTINRHLLNNCCARS